MSPAAGARAGLVAIAVVAVSTITAGSARAQHDHHHHGDPAPAGDAPAAVRPFEVGLALVGARYDQMLYTGDYAGVGLSVAWHRGRLGLRASVPAYHLRRNGQVIDGVGDATVGADVLAVQRGALSVGGGVTVTLPTGEQLTGLGMGHLMLMPALWASRDGGALSLGATVGWCGAIGADPAHHDHGAWPLVEPMSSSELMASVRGDVAVARRVTAGVRLLAAFPLQGDPTRVVGGVGGRWRGERTETGAEVQAGLAGDPFTVRALVTSALRF